jgi:hypothetical protein
MPITRSLWTVTPEHPIDRRNRQRRLVADTRPPDFDLVLPEPTSFERQRLPDSWSGDSGPKLRPHCDQATRDRQGQMPDSDRRGGR